MLRIIRDLFGNRDLIPAGRVEPTIAIFPHITFGQIAQCRRILHRTSPASARSIIKSRQIFSHNGPVSFSVNPSQINQADQAGAILVFEWSGPISDRNEPEVGKLLHVLSPDYIESLIRPPSQDDLLTLIGLIEPDLIEVREEDKDFGERTGYTINNQALVFAEPIAINVVSARSARKR